MVSCTVNQTARQLFPEDHQDTFQDSDRVSTAENYSAQFAETTEIEDKEREHYRSTDSEFSLKSKSSPNINVLLKTSNSRQTQKEAICSPKPKLSFESELTFSPKLNSLSLKLAKSKATIAERIKQGYECRIAVLEEQIGQAFTFKPNINEQSSKIADRLNSDFWARQQLHLAKQRKLHNKAAVCTTQTKSPNSGLSQSPSCQLTCNSDDNDPEETGQEDMSTSLEKGGLKNKRRRKKNTHVIQPGTIYENSVTKIKEKRQTSTYYINTLSDGSVKKKGLSKLQIVTNTEQNDEGSKPTERVNENKEQSLNKINQALLKSKTVQNNGRRVDNNHQLYHGQEDERISTGSSNKMHRTRTLTYPSQSKSPKMLELTPEKFVQAKRAAEKAVQEKKVFICIGPYKVLRQCLRQRGWVEKYFKADIAYKNAAVSKKRKSESDQSDNDDIVDTDTNESKLRDGLNFSHSPHLTDVGKDVVQPGMDHSENCSNVTGKDLSTIENSVRTNAEKVHEKTTASSEDLDTSVDDFQYWIMSRIVRNCVPSFIWTCKRDDIDFRYLQKDQIVNHYVKAGSFTTKAGLCVNLRNLLWFEQKDADSFFPRCHRLSSDIERLNFIDDFRMTTALSVVKLVVQQYGTNLDACSDNCPNSNSATLSSTDAVEKGGPLARIRSPDNRKITVVVPSKVITLAKRACSNFLKCKEHDDIEEMFLDESSILPQVAWDELIEYYYQISHHGGVIAHGASHVEECEMLLTKMRKLFPQIDMDGTRNIWIVKPGAKSRGRGIVILDKLQDILHLVSSNVSKRENRLVVQKYIERPLLIYNTKFDIRQWYLVTDWNPLTIWFYQKCYLRFCGQEFTFDKFDPQYHLANNSIQKHYKNGERSSLLPNENMWTCDQFKEYLREKGKNNVWEELIYPSMQKAIIYSLECCQDDLEYRKNSFELYGADFMLGEDYKPWLLEINCSPAMGASTAVTEILCAQVIEDMLKVVIDRRDSKNCDTGHFELIYKQPYITVPPYIGSSLAVEGEAVKKPPGSINPQFTLAKMGLRSKPRDTKASSVETDLTSNPDKDKIEAKKYVSSEKAGKRSDTPVSNNESCVSKNVLGPIHKHKNPPRTAPEVTKVPLKRADFRMKRTVENDGITQHTYPRCSEVRSNPHGCTGKLELPKTASTYHITTANLEFTHSNVKHTFITNANTTMKETFMVPERLTRQALKACRGQRSILAKENKKCNLLLFGNGPKPLTSIALRPVNSNQE